MVAREVKLQVPKPAKKAAKPRIESVDFDVPESKQYTSYVAESNSKKLGGWKGGFRWLYLSGVGIGAGLAAVFIQVSLHYTLELKFGIQERLASAESSVWTRYAAWLLTSLCLVSVAGALVCYVEPLAAGSGIPEIKCYLNGINQENVLRFKTLIAKATGIVCSVAAGLPCGKEGPMIHSGAIVGAQAAKASAGPLVQPYRPSHEARDLTAAGAAAGVAAAFGAPIGGVLFTVEEGATHMNPIILVRSFVCASFAALTVRYFTGPALHGTAWGILGTKVPVEFGRFHGREYKIWELLFFGAIGVAGGLMGAAANALNTQLTKWRMRNVGPRGNRRFVEVLGVTAVIVSFNFWAPLLQAGPQEMGRFSPVQRLFVDAGGEAIHHLLHHAEDLQPAMLLLFGLAHYAQLIWTYGLGVPSGLFVPALLGGASFGRLVGQVLNSSLGIAATPGAYALVGAAAMMSGMGRITISLSVLLMETTGESEWGLPIFLATVAAKWTADLFNKGIYDIHIELKHVPLLELKPSKQMMTFQAYDIMTPKVVALDSVVSVEALVTVLQSCEHNGFPVVNPAGRFLGLVDRSTLQHLLHLGSQAGAFTEVSASQGPRMVEYEEMLEQWHPTYFPSLSEVRATLADEDYSKMVDLQPYTNMNCFSLPEHTSAMRCYRLFLEMGLRHLPVLGRNHEVSGIITRKDLLAAQEGHVKPREKHELPVVEITLPSLLEHVTPQDKTDKEGESIDIEAQVGPQSKPTC